MHNSGYELSCKFVAVPVTTAAMYKHPLQIFRETQRPEWTRDKLAGEFGVTRVTIWRWETGERFPEREHWPKIRNLTGLSAEELSAANPATPSPHEVV